MEPLAPDQTQASASTQVEAAGTPDPQPTVLGQGSNSHPTLKRGCQSLRATAGAPDLLGVYQSLANPGRELQLQLAPALPVEAGTQPIPGTLTIIARKEVV